MRLESSRRLRARSVLVFCFLKQGVTSALCYRFTLLVASDVFLLRITGSIHVYLDTHASKG